MRNITSDNIVRMEKRATNKFGLFLVVIAVLIIFGGGGFLVYKYRDRIDWDIKLPWENFSKANKEEEKNNTSKKKKNRELIIPRLTNDVIIEGNSSFKITEVKADDRGYLFTGEYLTNEAWSTLTVDALLIDGYYTTTKFEVSDESDLDGQKPTIMTFRINKTELDSLNIHGFQRLSFYSQIEEPYNVSKMKYRPIDFENDVEFQSGREGLLKVDEKGSTLIEYYQTIKADDATYIYFEARNSDVLADRKILIKKLLINNRLYEMPEFEKSIYKGATDSFYIKIPKEKIKDVEEFLVSFYIINETEENTIKSLYITNEYSKTL